MRHAASDRHGHRPGDRTPTMPHHSILRAGKPDASTGGSEPEDDEGSVGQDAEENIDTVTRGLGDTAKNHL